MIRPDRYFVFGSVAIVGLISIFLFQRFDIAAYIGMQNAAGKFFVNRSIRFVLNDVLAILLIYSLFKKRKYVLFALWVQLAGMGLILLPYFVIKFYYPSYNGPLVSFLHRLVLNPTLLLLLIPAFYYQESRSHKAQ
jgi:exosortase F-associated protein